MSAGIDYEYIPGQIPGSLARVLTARFKLQRLEAEAARASPAEHLTPGQQGYVEQYNQEHALQGGTVIVGRSSLKEYLWALKEAWTTTLDLDRERKIAETDVEAVEDAELAEFVQQEGLFEPSEQDLNRSASATTSSLSNPIFGAAFRDTYASIQQSQQQRDSDPSLAQPEPQPESPAQQAELSPSGIPAQPPLLLLPFSHPLGSMVYWPQKLYAYFFGERARASAGASEALKLVYAHSRPFDAPERSQGLLSQDEMERNWLNADGKVQADADDWSPRSVGGDLDWESSSERLITKVCPPSHTQQVRLGANSGSLAALPQTSGIHRAQPQTIPHRARVAHPSSARRGTRRREARTRPRHRGRAAAGAHSEREAVAPRDAWLAPGQTWQWDQLGRRDGRQAARLYEHSQRRRLLRSRQRHSSNARL